MTIIAKLSSPPSIMQALYINGNISQPQSTPKVGRQLEFPDRATFWPNGRRHQAADGKERTMHHHQHTQKG
ncbi:hypothetical protein LY78DRAFT_657500 [Colletotrichum sublineola]|nr:hypothetical protein LY78DRAFT_657500 [Colletotrichum sublineola]